MTPIELFVAEARANIGKPNGLQWWEESGLRATDAAWAMHHGLQWCGVFALACAHRAGLLLARSWVAGKGFILHPSPLPVVSRAWAEPGLLVYHVTHQHHAIIEDVDAVGWTVINGNGWGGVVSRSHLIPSKYSPAEVTLFRPLDVARAARLQLADSLPIKKEENAAPDGASCPARRFVSP